MDGVFVLKMLTIHSGILVCTEVVDVMWDEFLKDIGNTSLTFHTHFPPISGKYPEYDLSEKPTTPGSDLETPRPPPRKKTSVLRPLVAVNASPHPTGFLTASPLLDAASYPFLKRPPSAAK